MAVDSADQLSIKVRTTRRRGSAVVDDPTHPSEKPGMRFSLSRVAKTIVVALLLVACSSATSPAPTTTPY